MPRTTIRNIILHMAGDAEHMVRLDYALKLARQFGAHIEIAYMVNPIGMPAEIQGRGASAAYLAEATAISREKLATVQDEIVSRCRDAGVEWTWEVFEGEHNRVLADRSLFADLIIVSQDHGIDPDEQVTLEGPGNLLSRASCPVMVLPRGTTFPEPGHRILVAWKDSPEACHVVRRGRAFLAAADKVFLLTVTDAKTTDAGRDIVGYLKRHDLEVEAVHDTDTHHVGRAILRQADQLNCDLILMGAFGRARWKEILSGGNTDHVLNHATRAVLLSH
ncbi:MAG: universal stress protein [Rhodospirillaceae bacterium]|nr:universal stress protein [Rhodospirillaceae bacterium]